MALIPYGLLAELTHRCPLQCPYCSNPVDLVGAGDELSTAAWCSVLSEAAQLGIVEVHLSGGEPLCRADLCAIASHARALDLYINLVTSGWSLDSDAATALAESGVEHVQLSFQGADAQLGDRIAGVPAHDRKLRAARAAKAAGMALTVNAVLHRHNIDQVAAIIAMAEDVGADRLELANAQWYGWAARNQDALAPSTAQIEAADRVVRSAAEGLADRIELTYVRADLVDGRPKACTGGWGRVQLTVTPDGFVLPCAAARQLRAVRFERVGDRPLEWIWHQSESFNRFRGTAWMSDPCRTCEHRDEDFGGCRCQAYQLLGDAAATDPACRLSPHHDAVAALVGAGGHTEVVFHPRRRHQLAAPR
ncbi:MAG: pyrroloquinoline quinone biosynthesis protein PqqE [Acidimicrobiales bacterium]